MAYQGFTSGDINKDSFSLKLFTKDQNIPVMLTQSFAKNMGLYGHRIGLFSTLCDNETERENVNGILKAVARRTYSNPPIQGAKIVKTVLGNPELYKIWEQDI
jgi:aspartate aminotransferase, mitochondrial